MLNEVRHKEFDRLFFILKYYEAADQLSCNYILSCFIAITYSGKCEVWPVKRLFAVNHLYYLATSFNTIQKVFTFEEMCDDTSIKNKECGFGMQSDNLCKSLFARESRDEMWTYYLAVPKVK
jgi:hypothetical protein